VITRVRNINPVQLGVVSGVLYALLALVIALLMLPFMTMFSHFGGGMGRMGAGLGVFGGTTVIIMLPVFYGVTGFVGGIITALIYNLVAAWTGGIEITLATHEPVATAPVVI